MKFNRNRVGVAQRLCGVTAVLATALGGGAEARAQGGSTFAMTPYDECRTQMVQTDDVNNDGKRDYLCLKDSTYLAANGIKILSGAPSANGQLPVLARNLVRGLGGRLIQFDIRVPSNPPTSIPAVAACSSDAQAQIRVFRRNNLADLGAMNLDFHCNGLTPADLDGDGDAEILISGVQSKKVLALKVKANSSGTAAPLQLMFAMTRPAAGFGWSLATLGDLNGDGKEEWAVGAPNAAKVLVMLGDPTGAVQIQELAGATPSTLLGHALLADDMNNDGVKELLVGAPNESTVYVYGRTGSSLQVIAQHRRAPNDALGGGFSDGMRDLNGDNVPDYAATYTSPTAGGSVTLISGRTGQAIRDFPGFYRPPSLTVKESHIESERVYGNLILGKWTILPGSNNNGDYFWIVRGDNWGCPTLNVATAHSPHEYAGVFGNDGQVPTITVPKGCAVPGGDIVVRADMSPNAPVVILGGAEMSSPSFPAIAGSANKLAVKRDNLEVLEPALAGTNGIATAVVRDIHPTLTDPDGSGPLPAEVRWFLQAFQFAQFAPTAQASGKGIASSMGYQLRAVQ